MSDHWDKMSIRSAIEKVLNNEMLLPAIQRKYVWDEEQIIGLMDSLMRGYPIGTFLIWKINVKAAIEHEYTFYTFIRNYHERERYANELIDISAFQHDRVIWGVLDGQQRLSSLLIAIAGTYAHKLPRKRWDNLEAFPAKSLFFNLFSLDVPLEEDSNSIYEFGFFADRPATDESHVWIKVSDVLKIEEGQLFSFIKTNYANSGYDAEVLYDKFLQNLTKLWETICKNEIIQYFPVQTDDIDEVLDIFVRTNSGGTVLSKSDLLFSTIVSSWQNAREEMDALIKTISGKGFWIDSDFIIRTCLMVLDLSINLKVQNLSKPRIETIKQHWKDISAAVTESFDLLSDFGFDDSRVTSYNAIIPIVYLVYKGCDVPASKNELRKLLIVSQVKQLFGRSSNYALSKTREGIRKTDGESYVLKDPIFSLTWLDGISIGNSNFAMDDDDIEALFDLKKGSHAFMVLSLLYPDLKLGQIEFHMDHLHPYVAFEDDRFDCPDVSLEQHELWKTQRDTLANLQLLEGRENESKNASSLVEWMSDLNNARWAKYIPANVSLDIRAFGEFIVGRQNLMTAELKRIFE